MLYKPLVSLVMAFAAMSSVAASVAPAHEGPKGVTKGPGDHAMVQSILPKDCNNTLSCCDLPAPPKNLTGENTGKPNGPPPTPQNVTVGGCSDLDINAISKCAKPQVPVCCKRNSEDVTKAHACQPLSLNTTN